MNSSRQSDTVQINAAQKSSKRPLLYRYINSKLDFYPVQLPELPRRICIHLKKKKSIQHDFLHPRSIAKMTSCAGLLTRHNALHITARAVCGVAALCAVLLAASAAVLTDRRFVLLALATIALLAAPTFFTIGALQPRAQLQRQCGAVPTPIAPPWIIVVILAAVIGLSYIITLLRLRWLVRFIQRRERRKTHISLPCMSHSEAQLLSQDTCAICLDDLSNSRLSRLSCDHVFHLVCIERWVTDTPVCPLCKKEVDVDELAHKRSARNKGLPAVARVAQLRS